MKEIVRADISGDIIDVKIKLIDLGMGQKLVEGNMSLESIVGTEGSSRRLRLGKKNRGFDNESERELLRLAEVSHRDDIAAVTNHPNYFIQTLFLTEN